MAGMYAVYHGKDGLKYIADKVHYINSYLANALTSLGFEQTNASFFDTITIKADAKKLKKVAEENNINFNYIDNNTVSISINETVSLKEINEIVDCFKSF